MSSAAAPVEEQPKKKKGGIVKLLIMVIGAVLLIGAGVGAGIYASGAGMLGGGHAEEKEDPNKPKLMVKGEGGEGHAETGGEAKEGGGEHAEGPASPNPNKYQATYYTLPDPFTSNIRNSDGFMQVGIGVSTYYDQRVIDNLERNAMPVRSAILLTLADQDALALSTPDGKRALQKALKDAINQVLITKEGFGGIDDVYFTSLIIQ